VSAVPASQALRDALVNTLKRAGALGAEPQHERAFRTVPRELFLPGVPLDDVYSDAAIVTKVEDGVSVSSSSQPAIMALMLRQLDVQPGQRVLEIGAGTGYNAALLRELVGPAGAVDTVDIDAEVADWARERLDAAGYEDVRTHCADGAEGWPAAAPYDRVILTVGAADIAPAWVAQLRDGGVLVLPLGLHAGQVSLALEKRGAALVSRSAQPCGFMRMRGALAGTVRQVALSAEVGVNLDADADELARLTALVREPPRRAAWPGGLWDGCLTRRALRDPRMTTLNIERADFSGGGFGLVGVDQASLSAVVGRRFAEQPEQWTWGSDAARDELRAELAAWQAAGAPPLDELHVSIYPLASAPEPAAGATAVDTRWWRVIIADGALPGV
jgi:protein-L-isoaspartate(D-aspartate) O-methyltransferase